MLVYWRVNSIEQQFMLQSASKTVIRAYPPVIKRGNGKSIIDEGCNGNIIYEWGIFQPAMFDYRKVPVAQVWSQLAAAWNVWSISFSPIPSWIPSQDFMPPLPLVPLVLVDISRDRSFHCPTLGHQGNVVVVVEPQFRIQEKVGSHSTQMGDHWVPQNGWCLANGKSYQNDLKCMIWE